MSELGTVLLAELQITRWQARLEGANRALFRALEARTRADLRALTAASWWDDPLADPLVDQIIEAEILPVARSVFGEMVSVVYDAVPVELRTFPPPDFERQVDRLDRVVHDMTRNVAEQLGTEFRQGVGRGESIDKLSGRVLDTFTANEVRARRIARTETISATNGLQNETAVDVAAQGIAMQKRWIATFDRRTRETHADANGQTVALDQPFSVGGYDLDFPGDPNGPPQEVINCRCTSAYEPI